MKRIAKKIWNGFISAWKWVFNQLKDRKNRIIFYIVFLAMSAPVWLSYILGIIFKNGWLISIGTTCFIFWQLPGTPFLVICVGITTGIRAILNKTIWKGVNINENKK